MVFSSILFLLFFLPALFFCYFCLPARFRTGPNLFLPLFSLFFYACCGLNCLPVLLGSIAANYLCGLLVARERPVSDRRIGLWVGVLFGTGMASRFLKSRKNVCCIFPILWFIY